jgi:hypothetical protein
MFVYASAGIEMRDENAPSSNTTKRAVEAKSMSPP